MNTFILSPEKIGSTLAKHLTDSNSIFVFPTDTVMNSWIDWIVTHPTKSGFDAVPFERFIAWDNFKSTYLCAQENGKTVIPTLLKQLFVHNLIKNNANQPLEKRFKVIINPKDEFATTADSFADWLTQNLSSLHFWKNRLELYKEDYGEYDDEDLDYIKLYDEYKSFLDENNLFEPAWVENVEFSNKKNSFIIIYQELLQDFSDFTEILEKQENITLYTFPKDIPSPKAYLYTDSRKELRQTMLQIIQLVNCGKADWSEIALSIPDIDTYRPYIEREFNLYKIPYVIKSGQKLTKNCAGRIFQEISDCYTSDFTFDSVRTLLLDECVPWKDELLEKRESLIREGNRMRCICSPFETDIWLSALTSKINRLKKDTSDKNSDEVDYYEELKNFYIEVKKSVSMFFSQKENTFSNIRRSWNVYKTTFLKETSEFSEEANNILSRCIKELEEIISIETKYAECKLELDSPYQFFLKILNSKTYTPQNKATGVNIYKYKLSAAANIKFQFVIDSSQKNLEIPYKRLTFLNTTKRSKLHLLDDDKILNATEVFIKLYAKQTNEEENGADENFVHFSAATDSFAGFAIPHSLLSYTKEVPNLDEFDYILKEKNLISNNEIPKQVRNDTISLTPEQKEMFENWKNTAITVDSPFATNERITQLLSTRINPTNKKLNISARGDLERFFPCPRKWIYKSILKLKEDSLDTDLMQNYDMGNLNHTIMELFMKKFIDKQLPIYDKEQNAFISNDSKNITQEIESLLKNEIIDLAIKTISDFRDAPLVIKTLTEQKNKICETIILFFKKILLQYPEQIGGCTVLSVEDNYIEEKENFIYKGKIDTIVQTPDKEHFIVIDYKNSSSSIPNKDNLKVDKNDILKDFQMPLYYKLVTANKEKISTDKSDNDIFGMYYYAIKDSTTRPSVKQDEQKNTRELYEQTLQELDNYAQLFTEKFTECSFDPLSEKDPKSKVNVKSYENCIVCPFKSICRTTYSIAGKEIAKK